MLLFLQDFKEDIGHMTNDDFHDTEEGFYDAYFDENWDDEGKDLYEWSQKLSIEAVGQPFP